jgi:hypothetical protein
VSCCLLIEILLLFYRANNVSDGNRLHNSLSQELEPNIIIIIILNNIIGFLKREMEGVMLMSEFKFTQKQTFRFLSFGSSSAIVFIYRL